MTRCRMCNGYGKITLKAYEQYQSIGLPRIITINKQIECPDCKGQGNDRRWDR